MTHMADRLSIRYAIALSLLLAAATAGGCGDNLAHVTGAITLDGEPLRGGAGDTRVTVQFQPAGGVGSTAIGLADENGNYTMGTGAQAGVPPGEYLVSCSASRLTVAADGKTPTGARQITDAKYASASTSGLKFVAVPGANVYDIALVSSPGSNGQAP
jgi:hypothetical protein